MNWAPNKIRTPNWFASTAYEPLHPRSASYEDLRKLEIYKAFCLNIAQGHIKGVPSETRIHARRFASLAC